jgi:hypothetical protein
MPLYKINKYQSLSRVNLLASSIKNFSTTQNFDFSTINIILTNGEITKHLSSPVLDVLHMVKDLPNCKFKEEDQVKVTSYLLNNI